MLSAVPALPIVVLESSKPPKEYEVKIERYMGLMKKTKKYHNGKLHCDFGPAVITSDGSQYWYNEGLRHRIGAPAVIEPDGSEQWYIHGRLHRFDGPAITVPGVSEEWYLNGYPHREDGPAYVNFIDRSSFWYKMGRRHREDGPAVITDSENFWFLNNVQMPKAEWISKMRGNISDEELALIILQYS